MSDDGQQAYSCYGEDARIDALCDELERAWKAGEAPRFEEFLRRVDESMRPAAFRDFLKVEVELRRGRRERVAAAEYLKRFPGFEEAILDVGPESDVLLATVTHDRAALRKAGEVEKGILDQAAAEAELLSGLTPTHESFFVSIGNALVQGGVGSPALLDEAIMVLAKGRAEFPDNKAIYALLRLAEGMRLVKNREWDRAIALSRSRLRRPPKSPASSWIVPSIWQLVTRKRDSSATPPKKCGN